MIVLTKGPFHTELRGCLAKGIRTGFGIESPGTVNKRLGKLDATRPLRALVKQAL